MRLETYARTCYNFYISFIPLDALIRYTDRNGCETVEYSDHELVCGIKGGDTGALEFLTRHRMFFIAMMQNIGSYVLLEKFYNPLT